MSLALAIDLGGTSLRIGLADTQAAASVAPLSHGPAPTDLRAFTKTVRNASGFHAIRRIGVAVPGLAVGTTCRWIPSHPYLDGVDLADLFPGVDIALGNDAQLALLAEATAGAAKTMTNVVLLSIGTGIGSAVLAGGRILRGAQGGAASFGWACADLADRGDERDGWLERHASGRALDRLAASVGLENGAALIRSARDGDDQALLEGPAQALGACLAGAVALLDPEAVVITGGVAEAIDRLAPSILAAMRRQLPSHLRNVRLMAGAFGPGASLVGAAIAACGSPAWDPVT